MSGLRSELKNTFADFVWAPGQILWDDPRSIQVTGSTRRMQEVLYSRVGRLERELLIESAYFVVRDRGVKAAKGLQDRGVRVRVLTNSLSSNDVLAAHAGYAERRGQLLENGVELYELRPDAGTIKQRILSGRSKAALHTKAIVFDRKDVFIGSFNLDPRSGDINTEAGLYVASPELAEQVIAYVEEGLLPQNSYQVLLDEEGDLVWATEDNGREVRYEKDPGSSLWQRLMSGFIGILPLEDQL